MAFRAARYWDLEGTFRRTMRDRRWQFPATLVTLDGQRLASGRDFDRRHRRARQATPTSCCSTKAARARARRPSGGPPFDVASVEYACAQRAPESAVHHVDAAAGGGAQARLQCGPHAMHVAQGLYERGLITYMRTDSTSLSDQAVRAARSQIGRDVRRRLPARPTALVPQQGEERAGSARGDPPRGRSHAHRRRLCRASSRAATSAASTTSSGSARSRRRWPTPASAVSPSGSRPRRRAGEAACSRPPGRTIEFPGYLRAYVEGADDPDAELEDRESILPPLDEGATRRCDRAPPVRAHHAAARALYRSEPGEGARGARHRPPFDLRERDRHHRQQARLRVEEGHRARPHVDRVRQGAAARALLRHLIDYEFTATMEEALDSIARGEGEAEKWLHSFYFGNGQVGLAGSSSPKSTSPQIDKAEVNTVHIGHDAEGRELTVRVWPNGANIERGDEKASDPRRPRARRAHARDGRGAPRAAAAAAPASSAPIPTPGSPCSRSPAASARSCSSASRSRGIEGEAEAGVAVRVDGPVGSHARAGARAAVAAAGRRRLDAEGEEITAQNGRYGPYLQERHRQPQPRVGGRSSSP